MTILRCFALAALAVGADAAVEPECKTFEEIYSNGKNLCEKMWGDAFVYTPETSPAYTMWWFQNANPNEQTTKDIIATMPERQLYGADPETGLTDQCLDSYHKDKPSAEPALNTCEPWRERGCCKASTVKDDKTIKEAYGAEYHWDRCGQLSAQCHAFFVYEACFYECEPAAELFRKYPKHADSVDHPNHYHNAEHTDTGERHWEVYKMPIQASFCDRWFDACRTDRFCASDGGNFFSCAAEVKEVIARDDDSLATGWIVLVVILAVVAVVALAFGIFLVVREKKGKPVYYKPVALPTEPTEGEVEK